MTTVKIRLLRARGIDTFDKTDEAAKAASFSNF